MAKLPAAILDPPSDTPGRGRHPHHPEGQAAFAGRWTKNQMILERELENGHFSFYIPTRFGSAARERKAGEMIRSRGGRRCPVHYGAPRR